MRLYGICHLLGLSQYSNDFSIQVCYSVHVASVWTMIPTQ